MRTAQPKSRPKDPHWVDPKLVKKRTIRKKGNMKKSLTIKG